MSTHDDKELWMVVKPTGKIVTVWCSCMAGASRCCNHIIATLYKAEYANSNSFCSPPCTSIPCGWNQSTDKVIEPKRISEIAAQKKIRTKFGENSKTEINREENRMVELNKFDPRITKHQNMTGDRLSNLLFSLSKSNPHAVLFKSTEECAIPTKSNLTVLRIANSISLENLNDDEKIAKFLRCLSFSDNDVQAIEKMTRTQSKSPRWKEHRKGSLTASKNHDVFTRVNTLAKLKSSYFPKVTPLVADLIYQDNNLDHIEAIKWGHDHEEDAAKVFCALEATKHLDFKVEPAGIFVNKTRAYTGASSDKITKFTCHGKSVVEIKCPHEILDETIRDNFKDLDFLALNTDANLSMNKKYRYYAHINSQIVLAKSAQGYFVVWTTKDIFVEKIDRDLIHWSKVSINQEVFFKSYVAKALLGLQLLTFCGKCRKKEISKNEHHLRSICCDRCSLWYHFKCQDIDSKVNLDNEWFCTTCLTNIAGLE